MKSVKEHGAVPGVRGSAWVVEKDTDQYLLLTCGALAAAVYKAFKEDPDNENLQATILTGIPGASVYRKDTPQAVLQWLKDYNNSFHEGRRYSFPELLQDCCWVLFDLAAWRLGGLVAARWAVGPVWLCMAWVPPGWAWAPGKCYPHNLRHCHTLHCSLQDVLLWEGEWNFHKRTHGIFTTGSDATAYGRLQWEFLEQRVGKKLRSATSFLACISFLHTSQRLTWCSTLAAVWDSCVDFSDPRMNAEDVCLFMHKWLVTIQGLNDQTDVDVGGTCMSPAIRLIIFVEGMMFFVRASVFALHCVSASPLLQLPLQAYQALN